jgi:hypothetical protein
MNTAEMQKEARKYVRPALEILADIAVNGDSEKVRKEAWQELMARRNLWHRDFLK